MTRLMLFIPLLFLTGCAATPEAHFDILSKNGTFDVRTYHPRIVAETTVEASYAQAPNIGFRRLADYIFGNNKSAASIAMTAPVETAAAPPKSSGSRIEMTAPVEITGTPAAHATSAEQYVITFTMPDKYTMATLPKPNNPEITLTELPAKTYAVNRFSWFTGAAKVQTKTKELRAYMAANHLTATGGEPILARYDPPWTLPMFRRNEILIEIQTPAKK